MNQIEIVLQAHLPCQPSGCYENMPGLSSWTNRQKIRGFVGMEWPADSWGQLVDRLETAAMRGMMSERMSGLYILILRLSCHDWWVEYHC